MKQSRELNIVKALCIILMVIGHTDAPAGVTGFIYLFHMPAFFFLSGYLLKEKYFKEPVTFIKKRLGTLYAPFVFWELVFLALTGVFCRLHILDTDMSFYGGLAQAFKYITFRGHQPLLNGYWFLKTLFFCSVICLFLLKWIKVRRWLLVAAMVLLAGLCQLVPADTTMISRLFLACAFYISGFLFSNRRNEYQIPVYLSMVALLAVAVVSLFWRESIFVTGGGVVPYYAIAILGTFGVFGIARVLDRTGHFAGFLDFVGRSTLTILTFHLLSFKLVSLFVIRIRHLPIDRLAEFPVIHESISYTWPIYVVTGVLVSLLIALLHKRLRDKSSVIKLF